VGTPEFIRHRLSAEIQRLQQSTDRLTHLSSIQIRLLLLRLCASNRHNHILRATPPSACRDILHQLDTILLNSFKTCQGFSSSSHHWSRLVRLPIRLGGSGLISMEEISPVAYIASVAAASSFRDLPAFAALRPAMDAWFQPEASSSDQPWEGAAELRDCLAAFHERMDEARRSHPNMASQLSSDPSLLPRSVDQLCLQPAPSCNNASLA
jgi:hypothetical protein